MNDQTSLQEYDSQLARISDAIIEMSSLVREQLLIAKAVWLHEGEGDFLQKVRDLDTQVNALDKEIEQLAMKILTLRNPMGVDLRIVSSSLKLCGYIETMGDLVKKVTKKVTISESVLSSPMVQDLSNVVDVIIGMIDDLLESFKSLNADKAAQVWKRDDEVDAIYRQLYKELQDAIQENPKSTPDYMHILSAAKNFERIGDYISRFAKVVYYISSGERFNKYEHKH